MKFLAAVGVFLLMALVIGAGMLLAVKGSPWLLILSLLAFVFAFGRLGCMPP